MDPERSPPATSTTADDTPAAAGEPTLTAHSHPQSSRPRIKVPILDPRSEPRGLRDLAVPAALAVLPTLLILKQPDVGTALILLLIFATICLLTKIRWESFLTLAVTGGIAAPLLWTYVLKDYKKRRILVFLNPEANIRGSGWHAHHARVAIGAGGWTGEGFMRSTQNQFLYLPEQHSDFPFAVFAED